MPQGFRNDSEMQALVEVEPWDDKWKQYRKLRNEERRLKRGKPASSTGKKDERADYMISDVFLYWLTAFHDSIVSNDPTRKVLLLIDNASCHTAVLKDSHLFPSIRILPLPPNSTSLTQPLDAGIIAVFKNRYRDYITRKTATLRLHAPRNANETDLLKIKPTNMDAWGCIVRAWNDVKPQSIRNCFRHVPILGNIQKGQLSLTDELDPDVAKALSQTRSRILRPIPEGPQDAPSTDQVPEPSNELPSGFDTAMQHCALSANQDDHAVQDVQELESEHGDKAMLWGSITKLLDGAPFICGIVDHAQESSLFQSFFAKPRGADVLMNETFPDDDDDDDDDDDYAPPMGSEEFAEDENGNPLPPLLVEKSWERSGRKKTYISHVDQLLSPSRPATELKVDDGADMEVSEDDDERSTEDVVMEGHEDEDGDSTENAVMEEYEDAACDDHSNMMRTASILRRKGFIHESEHIELLADTILDSNDFDADPAYKRRFRREQGESMERNDD